MLIAVLGFVLLSGTERSIIQENLDRKVSFEMRAAPAKRVLPELSKVAGVRMEVSALTADDVLIIKVDDVSVKDLMAKIAEATAAEWKTETDCYRLIRGPKLQREQKEAHQKVRAEAIRASQERIRKRLADVGPFDATKAKQLGSDIDVIVKEAAAAREHGSLAKIESVASRHPVGLLARRIALALDPKMLASLDSPLTIAFSTNPNRMQFPLPKEAHDAIGQFVSDYKVFEQFAPPPVRLEGIGLPSNFYWITHDASDDKTTAKVIVDAQSWSYAGTEWTVRVLAINPSSQIWIRSETSFSRENAGSLPKQLVPADPNEPALTLSPLAKKFAEFFTGGISMDERKSPVLDPELRPFLLQPDIHDFGELALSEILFEISNAQKVDLVACPSDSLSQNCGYLYLNGVRTGTQFLNQIEGRYSSMRVDRKEDWMLVHSSDPVGLRDARLDRSLLGNAARALTSRGFLSIDEVAQFANATGKFGQSNGIFYLARLKFMTVFAMGDWDLLRFHGSLSPTQRYELESGRTLLISQLTPFQQGLITSMVYGSHFGLPFHYTDPKEEIASRNSVGSIRTELFPDGIPRSAALSMTRKEDFRIIARSSDENFGRNEFDAKSLAYYLFTKSRPELANDFPNYESFRPAPLEAIEYRITLDDSHFITGKLDGVGKYGEAVSSPDQLPPDVYARVQKELTALISKKPPR